MVDDLPFVLTRLLIGLSLSLVLFLFTALKNEDRVNSIPLSDVSNLGEKPNLTVKLLYQSVRK
ncbi:hypothetical protein B6A42_22395 [Vibrio coralliilyticus]|nr:hypothetical protein B6A42_22395 [Vibrio coralliilyticus]